MDVAGIRDRIQATLDPNADIRRQAELDLKFAEDKPGFLDALLNILEAEQEQGVRLSTAIYLKNRVSKGWSASDESSSQFKPIPEDQKASFRNRLVSVLASTQAQVRAQLVPILQKILHDDFPDKWPDFLEITLRLLNSNDANSVFAGLQ
ncbi:hypothetical protein B0A49_11725, partial [Cryomyces minteri]